MNKNLEVVVQESQLEPAESKTLLEKFGDYEKIAQEWKAKAEMIVVTDASQETEIGMAKMALKKFAQMRIDVEKARKAMKEQSLRKGQAIDAVAKFLVSLISPIEEHLKLQANFVKIQEEKAAEEKRLAEEKKAEEERILAEEKRVAEEKRLKEENQRLKTEADKREKLIIEENKRKENLLKAKKERDAKRSLELKPYIVFIRDYYAMMEMDEKTYQSELVNIKIGAEQQLEFEKQQAKEQSERNEKLAAEKKLADEKQAELQKKIERERKLAELAKLEKEEKEREQAKKLKEKEDQIKKMQESLIECPRCHCKFSLKK